MDSRHSLADSPDFYGGHTHCFPAVFIMCGFGAEQAFCEEQTRGGSAAQVLGIKANWAAVGNDVQHGLVEASYSPVSGRCAVLPRQEHLVNKSAAPQTRHNHSYKLFLQGACCPGLTGTEKFSPQRWLSDEEVNSGIMSFIFAVERSLKLVSP